MPYRNLKYIFIVIFVIILFFSGTLSGDVETYGRCIIKYDNEGNINKIETFDDGTSYFISNKGILKIFPNSNIDLTGDNFNLNKGMIVIEKSKNADEKINTKMFFDNVWGSCQFFRICIPTYVNNIKSTVNIKYFLPDKKIDLNVKLQYLFDSMDEKITYYGFFVPYSPSWKVQNILIDLEIINNDALYCKLKLGYNIRSKEWQKQKVLFQKSKSNQLVNINQKKYDTEREQRQKICEENNPMYYFINGFSCPFDDINPITSEMGLIREWRLSNGKLYSVDIHLGIDIAKEKNTNVYASCDGVVRYAAYGEYVGNMVLIDHGLSLFSEYCHLNKILVKPGAIVKKGDLIGMVGMTGAATGSHLHWSTRVYGITVDPRSFLNIENIFIED